MINLLDVCKIGGKAVKDFEGEKKYIATGDIIDNQIVSFEKVTYKNKPSRANVLIDINDVIFAKMQNTIKVLKANENNITNIYSTGFYSLTPGQNLSKDFLYYFLNSKSFNSQKDKNCSGATQKALNNEGLEKILIKDLPSMEEQLKIVKKLSLLDELVNYKKNEINKLEELIKSQFVEMFGNPVLNEKDFDKRRLFDKCDIVTGNTPSRKIDDYYGDYIEWIKSDNIIDNSTYLTLAKESLSEQGLEVGRYVDKDCILMTCIAGSLNSIGNVAITDRKVSFNQQINGIIPRENDVYFMYEQFVLSKDYLHSPVNMSLKGILSKNQLGNLEFIFPPIELQKQFGNFYKQVDKQKFEFEKQLEKLEELQASLMQEYFG